MHRFNSFALCIAIYLFNSASAYAAGDNVFRISDWEGRAYWKKQDKKELDHCSAQFTNANKITIIYSLDRDFVWSLELSSPAWNFIKGTSFPVTFGLGNNGYFRQQAVATEAQLVRVQLTDSLAAFESLRKIIQFEFIAGAFTSQFNLTYNNQVLTALTQCVVRFGTTSRSRAKTAAWLKTSLGSRSDNNIDSPIRKEASALATNIMTEVAIPNAVAVKPNEIPTGITGDASWKAGEILFTVSILPQNETSEIGDLSNLIISGDAQKCRGDFFSGAMLDTIDTLRIARAFTNCQTPQSTISIYYLAIPRKQGGRYLFAIITNGFEITSTGEQTARDLDSKIRSTIIFALTKLGQAAQ